MTLDRTVSLSLSVSGEDNWNACRSADHAFVYGCVVVIHVAHRQERSSRVRTINVILCLATPPNAMIFLCGDVKMWDLIRAGFGMKIFGCLIILLASTTFLSPIFHFGNVTPGLNSTSHGNVTWISGR